MPLLIFNSLTQSLRRDRSYIITERRKEKEEGDLSDMKGARGRRRSMVSCKARAFSCQKLKKTAGRNGCRATADRRTPDYEVRDMDTRCKDEESKK